MNEIPEKIYIEEKVLDHPFTRRILSRLPDIPQEIIEDYKKIGLEKEFRNRANEDKNCLALAEKKGEVLKNVGRMEENQYYLFHEIDCRYDCEYCYLQYYFQTKVPVIFVNRDLVLMQIEEILQNTDKPYFHVGEVCDSLAFDELTEFSKDIAELFYKYPNGTVEFRTKSTNINNLVNLENIPNNLIPSWTFSPEYICDTLEHKTPKFNERLNAAKKCQDAGYTVG
ncbi:MAG: spore photoproduct lyase family protein, partial [Thermodesulfobacteriota bacterium]